MAVTIEWSTQSDFSSSTTLINHGNVSSGNESTAVEVFIRHDGDNPITSCAFYTQPYSGTYTGSASAATDFTELTTSWAANNTANGFGGFQINMDKSNSYNTAEAALAYNAKDYESTGVVAFTARTDDGDGAVGVNAGSAVPLHLNMGLSIAGQIQVGTTPGVGFEARIVVPVDEDTAGIRQFDSVLLYTYTS